MFFLPPLDFRQTPFTIIVAVTALVLAVVCEFDGAAANGYFERMAIDEHIWQGEVWRPFTTTLLHANLFLHAFFNIYCLLLFGTFLEYSLGSYRMIALVISLAFVSSLAEVAAAPLLWGHAASCVGLSGVIYGLFGFCWAGARYRGAFAAICQPQVVQWMIGWLLLCVLLTLWNILNVANVAHASGLGMGWLFGQATFDRRRRTAWMAAAAAAFLLAMSTLVYCP